MQNKNKYGWKYHRAQNQVSKWSARLAWFFLLISTLLLVGVSGTLAMNDLDTSKVLPERVTYPSDVLETYDPCGLDTVVCEGEEVSIEDKIRSKAREAGIDEDTAVRIAFCESSFNPSAKNPNSSATGIYQWTTGTWNWIGSPGDRLNEDDNINAFMEWFPKYPLWWECQ